MLKCRVLAAVIASVISLPLFAADWVTIKGQVVWPKDKDVPAAAAINVTADKAVCLAKGELVDDTLIVNAKSRGIKNVFVYLRPNNTDKESKFGENDIHPDLLKPKAVTHETDQPCCQFIPRNLALRSGDFINFKNGSTIAHNVKVDSDAPSPSFNKTLQPKGSYQDPKPFAAQFSQIEYGCSIHPWMKGKIMVFDHPYFALTDDDGKFEIKNAPAGAYRIVYHGERYHKGKEGNRGWPIAIAGNAKKEMELPPLEFVIPAN